MLRRLVPSGRRRTITADGAHWPYPRRVQDSRGRHVAAVLGSAVLWGTTGTVAAFAPAGSSPVLIGLGTFGFGALLLAGADLPGVRRMLTTLQALPLLALGAVGVAAYAGFYYWSMALVGVAIGNVLALGSGPLFAALLELVVERHRPSRAWVAATAMSVIGISRLSASAHSSPGSADGNPVLGVALGLAAGFGYALYSWAGARLIRRGHPSRPVMASIFTTAAAALLPAFVLLGPGPLMTPGGLLVLGYLALVPMAVAYLLFGYGLRGLSASTATTLALAEPVVATTLAVLVLHERLTGSGWVGMALIVAGLLLVARDGKSPRPRRPG